MPRSAMTARVSPTTDIVVFEPGTQFHYRGRRVELLHCLSLERVVVRDCQFDGAEVVSRAGLVPVENLRNRDTARHSVFADVSEAEFALATTREAAVKAALNDGRLSLVSARQLAKSLSVSTRTIRRWVACYRKCPDVGSFLPSPRGARPGKRCLRPEVEAIIHHAAVKKLGTAGNCSVRAVYELVRADCEAIGRSAPARSTILDRIKALKAEPGILPTAIRRKVIDRTRPVRGSATASKALEEVQIDHTLVDQHLVDCRDGQPLGRPWLTLAIDTATRVILGFVLTLEHPSRLSVALCMRHAIFPKEAWLEQMQATENWPMFGLMDRVFTDNGADFRSASFQLGCQRHGIRNAYRPVRTPRYGGIVERALGTFMKRLRLVPGNTFNEILNCKTPFAARSAVLTLDELTRWFINEFTAYHHEKHRGLGVSPLLAWERTWRTPTGVIVPRYPADPRTLFIDLLPHESRALGREGIHLNSLTYRSPALEPYLKPEARGVVRIDPRDISSVFLELPAGGHLQVPWTHPNWPRMSLWEWNEIRRRDYQRAKNADPQVVRRCLAANERLIDQAAAKGKLRARRRRARARTWPIEREIHFVPLPALPRTRLDVMVASVDSPVAFEILE